MVLREDGNGGDMVLPRGARPDVVKGPRLTQRGVGREIVGRGMLGGGAASALREIVLFVP